ncbi:MAG: heme exporter protein CcmB [Candidatus Latescibacterota bacterium]|nr:heme exporter protein CcmB [Candidatus Latescibacterota bacterium]
MSFLGRALAILRKDLQAEWRTKERLSPMVFFVLLVLLVFNFSFELGGAALREIGPGVLWSAYVFASLLGLGRSFADERENDALDALLLAPGDRGAVYLGKMLGNLIFLLAIELLSLPFFILFFNLSPGFFLVPLLGIFLLGSACLASVGTLFAAMSNNMRLRELLLPLLLLPMILPALISCIEATALILANGRFEKLLPHLQMLGVYAVVFTVLSLMLFEYAIEE